MEDGRKQEGLEGSGGRVQGSGAAGLRKQGTGTGSHE
jgi:hypothetical protein